MSELVYKVVRFGICVTGQGHMVKEDRLSPIALLEEDASIKLIYVCL